MSRNSDYSNIAWNPYNSKYVVTSSLSTAPSHLVSLTDANTESQIDSTATTPNGIAIDTNAFFVTTDYHEVYNYTNRLLSSQGVKSLIGGITNSSGYVNGPLANSKFNFPLGIAIKDPHTIYIADSKNHAIRMISGGVVSTLAGAPESVNPESGYVDGTLSAARFNLPTYIAYNSATGILVVADSLNHCIRKIYNSQVTTIGGIGNTAGYRDGLSSGSLFRYPYGVAFHGDNVVVADRNNNAIRYISSCGKLFFCFVLINRI